MKKLAGVYFCVLTQNTWKLRHGGQLGNWGEMGVTRTRQDMDTNEDENEAEDMGGTSTGSAKSETGDAGDAGNASTGSEKSETGDVGAASIDSENS